MIGASFCTLVRVEGCVFNLSPSPSNKVFSEVKEMDAPQQKEERLDLLKRTVQDLVEILSLEPIDIAELSRCPLCGRLTEKGKTRMK